jgi:outer membrane immunogenic protein
MKEISKKQVAYGVASATVGLMSAGSVFAAEGNTWTGFNVYGGLGYNTLSSDDQTYNASEDIDKEIYFSGTHSKSKISGSLGLGYDYQINDKFVVGVFGDINFANTKANSSAVYDNGNYHSSTSTSVKDAASLGLKLGYALSPNDLLYVSGGISRAKVDISSTMVDDYNNTYNISKSTHKTGKFIGLGLEHKVGNNLSIAADYRMTYYGAVETSMLSPNSNYNTNTMMSQSSKAKTQALNLVLKYTF